MVIPNVGDIVQIRNGNSNGRSSLPSIPIMVKVTEIPSSMETRFYAKPIDKKMSQNNYFYLINEVIPTVNRPRSTIKNRVIGEKVSQW